jgi:diguanylate cyclase (GGDEF)-like protein
MCKSTYAGRRAPRAAWLILLPVLFVASAASVLPAAAACLPSADPGIRELQTLVNQDAKLALSRTQALLESENNLPHPNHQRLAALYVVEAQAFSILELTSSARESVAKGLKYAGGDTDRLRIDLLATLAENVYDEGQITAADTMIAAAHAQQTPGSLADTCLLIGRGLLQYRQGRDDLAIGSLTQAYNSSTSAEFAEPRALAANTLSTVLRGMGDYSQALTLNQEAIDFDSTQNAPLQLSVDRFLRGRILTLMGKHAAAIDEFNESRRQSAKSNDTEGVAFADVRICEARIELGQLDQAAPACTDALATFNASNFADESKETQALLARIDLAQGRPEKALAALNVVLDHNGEDMQPRRVASLYEWRARTNAAMRNYRDAYNDLTEYVRRYTAANDADRTRQAAALRARFETDREIERNSLLKRELVVSQEQSQRQAQQLRWNAVVAASGIAVIALLVYFLISNLRFRQELVRLARQDGLTGLPNRRRTVELATEALKSSIDSNQPLTIAIIDMDHFKFINDRCGHATGDHVLKEFARLSRETLRPADVLGRWGGEEFLLIMPNADLEVAMATLERLRTLVFGVRLPSSGAGLRVSLSAGLALYGAHVKSLDELIARADSALYTAKNEGRDLVRISDENFLTSSGIRRATR